MSLIRKLAGETVIYGMSSIFPRILHYVVFTVYLTYKFPDQENFGMYKELYAYATILIVILTLRMETAFFRFGSREDGIQKSFSTAMLPLLVTTTIIVGILFFYSDSFAALIEYKEQPYYVKWFALILGFDALAALPFAKFRLENRPWLFMVLKLFNVIMTVVLVFLFLEILPRMGIEKVPVVDDIFHPRIPLDYVFIANLIASFLVFLLVIPELLKQKLEFDLQLWKKMLLYSVPLIVVGIAGNINTAFAAPLQRMFLDGNFSENLTEAGKYAAPASLAIFLNLFTYAFNYAAEPFFFKNYKASSDTDLFGRIALVYTIAGSIVLLVILLYLDLALQLIGKDYRAYTDIVPILLFANLFLGLYYNFSIWYKLKDKTYIGAIISIISAIITLVISIIFLPKIGYVASAWAGFACFLFMAIAGYITGRVYFPIAYPIGRMLLYMGLAVLVIFVSKYMVSLGVSDAAKYLSNTTLLILYLVIAYTLEKETFLEIAKKKEVY